MKSFTERVMVCATDQDGIDVVNYMFEFLTEKGVNIEEAIRNAASAFCKTKEGRNIYSGNCHCFNWGDFDIYVPNEFCEQFGFIKCQSRGTEIHVDFNEELVLESEIFEEEE